MQLDEDMSKEMQFHLDMLTMEYRERGMSPESARRRAMMDFGGMEQKKEEVRAARGVMFIDNRIRDIRFALRNLRKHPNFALVVVLTLALGIGANTAIFSVVNAVLLRPLPYPDSERLVDIAPEATPGVRTISSGGVFIDMEDNGTLFECMAAIHPSTKNMSGAGEPLRLDGWEVSHRFLDVLRTKPLLGRGFQVHDDEFKGNEYVIILSEWLWKSRFDADSEVIGRSVNLDDQAYEVIGIMPDEALVDEELAFFVPAAIRARAWKQSRDYAYVTRVIGRLKDGVSMEQAEAELRAAKDRLRPLYPPRQESWSVSLIPLHEYLFGGARSSLYLLLLAVGLVMLVACANVANLLLAKSLSREGEIALRASLGAGRVRLIGQLLTESTLLSVLGGFVGVFFGMLLIKPLYAYVQLADLPAFNPSMDWGVLGFVCAITLLTGVLFGLYPALRLSKPDLMTSMRNGGLASRGGGRRRVQSGLIVAQTALSVVLLVCVGLLLRSYYRVSSEPMGFQADRALVFDISCSGKKAGTPEARMQYADRLMEGLRTIPGVESVAMAARVPMGGDGLGDMILRPGKEMDTAYGPPTAAFNAVSPDYFEALDITLKQGRSFEPRDNRMDVPRVMVINESLRDFLFSGEDPLGKLLFFKGENWEVVGVVSDVRQMRQDIGPQPEVYMPSIHFPWTTTYVLKTGVTPLSLVKEVREVVGDYDADQAIGRLDSLDHVVAKTLKGRTVLIGLLAVFGASALLLVCIGIYGTMSFAVSQRTKELGIRIALGAGSGRVISMVQKQSMLLVLVGLMLGVGGGLGSSRFIASQLYKTQATDPWVLALVSLLLLLVGLVSSWFPAWRATRVDPVVALKSE